MTVFRKIIRVFKYGVAAGIVTGSIVGLRSNEWNFLSTGFVRIGRAAIAVAFVAIDYKISLKGLDPDSEFYTTTRSQVHTRCALRLRNMCWNNGGCFIKVGQHIGALEYLVPREYVEVMKVLHRDAPRSAIKDIYNVICQDLGKPAAELFASFNEEPFASASIAQVHKATLHDGSSVVVKVQHPLVKAHSFVDMATMELLVRGVMWLFPEFKFAWLAEEMRRNVPQELDFVSEAHNSENIAKKFAHLQYFKVPLVYWPLTTDRVLTMEFCDGGHINDRQYMIEHGLAIKDVLRKLGHLYSEMIFVQGYIHCDPHPGNVLVRMTPSGHTQIVLLDHGLYQTLSDKVRIDYCGLWQSMIAADIAGIKKHSESLGVGSQYPLFACMITARSWSSVSQGIDRSTYTAQEENLIRTNATSYLTQITEILNRVPRELLLVFKTNDLIRGIESALGSRADASSFLTMSRCCVRALAQHRRNACTTTWCQLRIKLNERWMLTRLALYEYYLWLTDLPVYRYVVRKIMRSKIAIPVPRTTLEAALSS